MFLWETQLPPGLGKFGYDIDTLWSKRVYGGRPVSCRAGLTSYTGVVALVALYPRGDPRVLPVDRKVVGAAYAAPVSASDHGEGGDTWYPPLTRGRATTERHFPESGPQPDDGVTWSDDTDSEDDRVALATAELRAAEEVHY